MESSETIGGRPAKAKSGGLGETTRFLLLLFLLAIILRSFIVAPFSIPSGSMLPRLMIGDFLFVAKWPYGYSRYSMPFGLGSFDGRIFAAPPEQGDVVVFRYPGGGTDDYVKRLIGLPGDTVQMVNGGILLNGKPVPRVRIADFLMKVTPNSPCRTVDPDAARMVPGDEPGEMFCAYRRYRETLPSGRSYQVLDQIDGPADNGPPIRIPAGHYYVIGDNRDDSEDSRFPRAIGGVGLLPSEFLIGRALITFFSVDGSAKMTEAGSWLPAVRWGRIGETF